MRRSLRKNLIPRMAILAIVVLAFLVRGSLSGALGFLQRPLVSAGTWVSARAYGIFDTAAVSPERVSRLVEERDAAAVDRAELEWLREENMELRDQIGFVKRRMVKAVPCAIVSRSIGSDASVISVDCGSNEGVVLGNAAVSGDGLLVGKVVSVSSGSSQVRMVSDRESATAVAVLNGTRTIGVAQGMAGALLSLQYVPQDEKLQVNDIVVTSGLEESVPSGLIVGIINAVSSDATAPFQSAILEPLSDARRIGSVSILVSDAL